MKVLITQLDTGLPMPKYAKPGDAGADIYSAIDITSGLLDIHMLFMDR
jgi:dUTP pyrophosphatase